MYSTSRGSLLSPPQPTRPSSASSKSAQGPSISISAYIPALSTSPKPASPKPAGLPVAPAAVSPQPPGYAHSVLETKWNQTLEVQHRRLKGNKYSRSLASQRLTYDSFKINLTNADRSYKERGIAKYTEKLLPALEGFDTFTRGITSIVQANGDAVTGFVWGTLQIIITAASRFGQLLVLITNMIQDLTITLTRLQQYLELFPNSEGLIACIHCLIEDYVGFCVSAYKFFLRWPPMYAILRLAWTALDYKFKCAKDDITKHLYWFELQRQYDVDRTLVEGTRQIQAALPAIIHSQPSVQRDTLYHVPYTRNPYFSGRDDVLTSLHSYLTGTGKNAPRNVQRTGIIHGIGGIGKTQVAVEYTFRYRSEYDYIFWLRSETQPELQSAVKAIVLDLNLSLHGQNSLDRFRQWLEKTTRRWLLVFDNAQDWKTLSLCWPCSTHGSIIVTAQDQEFAQVASLEVPLKPLTAVDGAILLLKHLRDEENGLQQENAKSISTELGGLPLAIAHIAGYLSQSRTPLHEFLEQFSERANSAEVFRMNAPMTTFQYEKTLGAVWDVALKRLTPDALQLIQILSMMNPDGVPEDMLYGDHESCSLEFLKAPNKMRFRSMIMVLRTQQLVSREEVAGLPCLSMHRSLQRSILHRLDEDYPRFQQTFDMAFLLIRRKFPRQSAVHSPQSEEWSTYELYRPHVMNLRNVYVSSKKRPTVSIELAEMLSDAGYYFYDRGIYLEGIQASDTAEEICAQFTNKNYVLRANVYTVAATVRWDRGISGRVKILHSFLKCLSLRQQYVNEIDVDVDYNHMILYSNAWSDVSFALGEFECYEEAKACADLSTILRKKYGEPWMYLESQRFTAQCLAGMGKVSEAVKYIVDGDSLPKELTDPTISTMATGSYPQHIQFVWANILINAGKLDEALEKAEAVLVQRKMIFGKFSREALSTYYMMAVIHQKKGDLGEAERLLKKALERTENLSNELIAQAEFRLGRILEQQGKISEATNYITKAEAFRNQVLKTHGAYLPKVKATDEQVYDHIAPFELGRVTIGAFQQTGKFPKLMEVVQLLRRRLEEVESTSVDLHKIAEICNIASAGLSIPEKEGFY